jgi:hypothetical protein
MAQPNQTDQTNCFFVSLVSRAPPPVLWMSEVVWVDPEDFVVIDTTPESTVLEEPTEDTLTDRARNWSNEVCWTHLACWTHLVGCFCSCCLRPSRHGNDGVCGFD